MGLKNTIEKEEAETIYKEYSNYIYRTVLFLTKSKELADDVTQETFIQVFQKYNTFDSSRPVKPWLYKIALNMTRNIIRRQKWVIFSEQLPETSQGDLVEYSVLKNEEEKELWEKINSLSLKSREIIILHFYAGLKLSEIAYSLGIPLGTCKSRLNFALKKLRRQLSSDTFIIIDKEESLYETI